MVSSSSSTFWLKSSFQCWLFQRIRCVNFNFDSAVRWGKKRNSGLWLVLSNGQSSADVTLGYGSKMSNSASQSSAKESPNDPDTAADEAKKAEFFEKYEWMVRRSLNSINRFDCNWLLNSELQLRPCDRYKGEHKECKSFRGRFQQYFVYGENLNCDQWREDYNNCQKWNWFKDKNAAIEVIKSEMKRSDERMKAHSDNTIWTKRDKPPEDWNQPLPDWMAERNENSFLAVKAKELQDEEDEAIAREAANKKQSGIAANTSSKDTPNIGSLCSIMWADSVASICTTFFWKCSN